MEFHDDMLPEGDYKEVRSQLLSYGINVNLSDLRSTLKKLYFSEQLFARIVPRTEIAELLLAEMIGKYGRAKHSAAETPHFESAFEVDENALLEAERNSGWDMTGKNLLDNIGNIDKQMDYNVDRAIWRRYARRAGGTMDTMRMPDAYEPKRNEATKLTTQKMYKGTWDDPNSINDW
jgi:hypothetical protein